MTKILLLTFGITCLLSSCTMVNKTSISFKAKIIYKSLKLISAKETILKRLLENPKRGGKIMGIDKFPSHLKYYSGSIEGHDRLSIWDDQKDIKDHIIFFHGGAYVLEAAPQHRNLMKKLTLQFPFRVTFIDYPLAPEHQAPYTLQIAKKAFEILQHEFPEDQFIFLGDSAGGGLALALLQELRDQNHPKTPQKTVLLSPWLDVSLDNPKIHDLIDTEVLLDLEVLKKCGRKYAGTLDLKDPKVSPLYGDLSGLGDILIFVSDIEILSADCLLLNEKGHFASGTEIKLQIKSGMIHDWFVLPIRETKEGLFQIAEFITKE